MELFGALVPLLFVAGFAGLLLKFTKAEFESFTQQWAAYAQSRQLSMHVGRFFPFRGNVLTGTVENVPIQLDHYVVSHGKSSTPYTRVVARAIEPLPLSLRVFVEGFFSSVGKLFGTQDIQVGHPAFDQRFMVKADNEALARSLLDAELCRALEAFPHESLSFEYQRGAVALHWAKREESAAVLDAAIRIVVLASRWRRPEQSLR
jgi:hypothetical protein